jgi:hypothetical protein
LTKRGFKTIVCHEATLQKYVALKGASDKSYNDILETCYRFIDDYFKLVGWLREAFKVVDAAVNRDELEKQILETLRKWK